MFQSTHPRRVRQFDALGYEVTPSFNPRTHVGCDLVLMLAKVLAMGFNPRTHVGCDLVKITTRLIILLFQSTHPRRVRPSGFGLTLRHVSFQSTHPRRVRLARTSQRPPRHGFNPRTHVGCDFGRPRDNLKE